MADNIDEEHLENPTIKQKENPVQEVIPTNDTETITPNQETENMEVHHQAHHEGKKNWKSYFWEFLMLFFAVFCGFLAEYQLEHKIERDREKQYVESMIADMKDDAIKIKKSISFCTRQVEGFDSLLQNIYKAPYTDSSIRMLYYLQRKYTSTRNPVAFNKRTISQLKNSGGLRLIQNKAASDSIIIYEETCEKAETQEAYFANFRMGKVNDFTIQLFDSKYIANYDRNTISNILNESKTISLLSDDINLIKQYANSMYFAKSSLISYTEILKGIENRIPQIIQFLEIKYHLN